MLALVGGRSVLGWGRGPAHPLPPANAPVAQVAAAYFDAALHQDCATTEALTVGQTFAWCTNPTMTSYGDLGPPTLLPKEQAGQDLQCVTATITDTPSSDGSLNAATRPWSLCFPHSAA